MFYAAGEASAVTMYYGQRDLNFKKRLEEFKHSEDYKAFNAREFIKQIDEHLNEKKQTAAEHQIKLFGVIRQRLTRYNEKVDFYNNKLHPIIRECAEHTNTPTIKKLVAELQNGVDRFTTLDKQSGFARILENAIFALNQREFQGKHDFNIDMELNLSAQNT